MLKTAGSCLTARLCVRLRSAVGKLARNENMLDCGTVGFCVGSHVEARFSAAAVR